MKAYKNIETCKHEIHGWNEIKGKDKDIKERKRDAKW